MITVKYNGKLASVNEWKNTTKTGHVYKTAAYRQFQKDLANLLLVEKLKIDPALKFKDAAVSITFNSKHDIDNLVKPILDAIEDSGLVENDNDIIFLEVWKYKEKNKGNKLSITLWEKGEKA